MDRKIRIAAICGSLRKGSYNAKALQAAAELAPEGTALEIIRLDGLPLFNEDVEAVGWPAEVDALRRKVSAVDGVLIATPEYNYSVPGGLKNAIDWLSRPQGSAPLNGKPVAIMGASTSQIGTARAQSHLRQIAFYNAMPLLASAEVLIFNAKEKFADDGKLIDPRSRELIEKMMSAFADWIELAGKRRG